MMRPHLFIFILLFIFHFNLHARVPSKHSLSEFFSQSQIDDVIIILIEDVPKECRGVGSPVYLSACHQTLLKSKIENPLW